MYSPDAGYYLVSRRLVHLTLLVLVVIVLGLTWAAYALAPRWLPYVKTALDEEARLDDPDVVVLRSSGRSEAAERAARAWLRQGGAHTVVLLGQPFAPDELAPAAESRRLGSLLALGVPRSSIVEIYEGGDLWIELGALAATARERDWRRILFLTTPGGSKRNLLGARRVLGAEGIAVGQWLFYDDEPEDQLYWWRDTQWRGIVLYNWLLYAFGRLAGRL